MHPLDQAQSSWSHELILVEKTTFTITLTRMVRFLKASRCGNYAWINHAPSPASIRRELSTTVGI